jgi:predicted adenine nucleotide alpha hydrolase (AANH) superfamily ATPase
MQKRNYQRELDRIIRDWRKSGRTPRLLLHACCGPCSSYVLEYLAADFSIELFYDNSNIAPRSEYVRRREELVRVLSNISAPHGLRLHEGVYDPARYAQAVKGLEHLGEGSARCFACYRFRMEAAKDLGLELGCDYFATTLSISPYKNADKINEIGEEIASGCDIRHLPNDFKKRGGYQRSIALCREWNIYRQHYCGCIYSMQEMQAQLAKRDQASVH